MTHPLVTQLRFARREFVCCLAGLSDEDARQRLLPMNYISWMVGHLAVQVCRSLRGIEKRPFTAQKNNG